jgi:glycosyltransferase involved in cell wall biosynthesis
MAEVNRAERRPSLSIGMFGLWGMNVPQRHFGGFETGFSEIAPRLIRAGHQVVIYCRRQEYPREARVSEHRGVRLVYVPAWGGKNLAGIVSTFMALCHAFLRERHDLYFFVNVGMGYHCALARMLGKRVVLNVNGLDWQRAKWGLLARLYFISAAHVALKVCHRLVTDAEAMRVFYREHFDRDTTMIAYGAYVEASSRPELIKPFGVERDGYYLIASRLIPENSPDLIIEAFLASGSRKKLVIAGGANYDSPFHTRLKQRASDRVLFTGHIDSQDVIKELHCNCFAYVHGHSVGGTNPALLKAMGYGNCILALDTVFNREVLDDAGILFPKDRDALARLMRELEREPTRVAELRRRGPQRILGQYTWEKVAGQYLALFREVAAGE